MHFEPKRSKPLSRERATARRYHLMLRPIIEVSLVLRGWQLGPINMWKNGLIDVVNTDVAKISVNVLYETETFRIFFFLLRMLISY